MRSSTGDIGRWNTDDRVRIVGNVAGVVPLSRCEGEIMPAPKTIDQFLDLGRKSGVLDQPALQFDRAAQVVGVAPVANRGVVDVVGDHPVLEHVVEALRMAGEDIATRGGTDG